MTNEHSSLAMNAICHAADQAGYAIMTAASEYERPCVIFRPKVSKDGDAWCALYGENLMEGVAGFGATPASAMYDFDRAWYGHPKQKQQP